MIPITADQDTAGPVSKFVADVAIMFGALVDAGRARYEAGRAKDIELAGTQGIDAAVKGNNLDALLFPGAGDAAIAAKPGYPTVIVPFGMVPNAPTPAFPAGFDAKPPPSAP